MFLQTVWIHVVPNTWQLELKPGLSLGLERELDTQSVSPEGQSSLRNALSDNFPSAVTF